MNALAGSSISIRARSSSPVSGSTSPGPTCVAINDRLPKQPAEEIFCVAALLAAAESYYATGAWTCSGSNALPVDSRAHAKRAFLLAIATAAMLWWRRATNLPNQVGALSVRVLAN
jgi:hypothetical protein